MKMAKFTTRKKSNKTRIPPEVAAIADVAATYIANWTRKEVNKLKNTPLCIPVKHGYLIGNYSLRVNNNRTCSLYNSYDGFVHTFDSKINAVLYTIYTIKKSYAKADTILRLDSEINKNYIDTLTFSRAVNTARKKGDYDSVDIKQSRLEIAQKRLEAAREEISRMHRSAKINKVWE